MLIEASRKGDIERVKALIAAGDGIEARDNEGYTALIRASLEGHIEVVKVLIENNADIEAKDNDGKTALMWASSEGHIEVVRLLIENNADIEAKDNDGKTALMWTSSEGHIEVVRLLIENKDKIEAKDNEGKTALIWASSNGHEEIVNFLIENNADIEAKDNDGWTALMWASYYRHIDILNFLIEKGADIDAKNNDGWTVLIWASSNRHKEIVNFFVENNADIKAKDKDGKTALMYASSNGYKEIVNFLIEKGADIEAKDNEGKTALMYASAKNRTKTAKALIKDGANIEDKDKDGKTALMYASAKGQTGIAKTLIKLGANIEAQDKDGKTALMWAYAEDKAETVEVLINAGAIDNTSSMPLAVGAENILFYGAPGSGKSYKIETDYCQKNDVNEVVERVVFYPDYSYSDFVGQILPRVNQETKKLEYRFISGPFTNILKKAIKNPSQKYYLIIEEINRGNAPAIFGDIFQLLDRDEHGKSKYGITNFEIAKAVYEEKASQEEKIKLPPNLWILATMNSSDQNVFSLDTAFQRRWVMKYVENNIEKVHHARTYIAGSKITWAAFALVANEIIVEANESLVSSEDKRLGGYFATECDLTQDRFPEKILKYLWDDAFKMNRTSFFRDDLRPATIDTVISVFRKAEDDNKLKAILKESVFKRMKEKSNPEIGNNRESIPERNEE